MSLSSTPSLRSVYHPQHQHHGPRQSSQQSSSRPPPTFSPSSPLSATLFSFSPFRPHIIINIFPLSTSLCSLIHNSVLLLLATIIGLGAFLPSPLTPSSQVLAHAPPRASYYEVTSNPVRSLLAGAHFGRLPVSPYYGFGSSRRYGSSPFKDATSPKVSGSGKMDEEVKVPRVRPFTDSYYAYTHESEPAREPLPIPSCKELRLMWLANKFSRHHETYRDNRHKGWEWVKQIPEISKLIDSVLHSQRTNKPAATTSNIGGNSPQQTMAESSNSEGAIDKYGTIKMSATEDQPGFGQIKPELPVYIAKIVPSRDNIEQMQAEKPTTKQEMTFGIIHTSPDDGEDDQEELVVGSSIRQPALESKQNPIRQKVGDIESEVRVDRNGNRAIFGKFLDNTAGDKEKSRSSVSSRTNSNERKLIKQDNNNNGKQDRDLKNVSPLNGNGAANRAKFQSSQTSRSMPGVWHNKPVVPSVRMVRDTNVGQ